jgi:AraC family transcriptional regulator
MSQHPENLLVFRSLYDSPIISVRDYSCHASRSGPAEEENCDTNNIVLMRHGAFSKHFRRRSVTADVNQAVFFSKGSSYRVSHPANCGDRGTVFIPSPRVLNDIVRELDPSVDEQPERPFPFITGPCDTGVFWRHRELVERLEAAGSQPLEPLWADVTALQLVAEVLEAAFVRQGQSPKKSRTSTEADHADRAEAAKTYLASQLSERVTLEDVSRAVYASLSSRPPLSATDRLASSSLPDQASPPCLARTTRGWRKGSHDTRSRTGVFQPQPLH